MRDWVALRQAADPLADDVAAALHTRPRPGENVLDRVRRGAAGGDPVMRRFLDATAAPPSEDPALLDEGRRFALRHAPLTFVVLLAGSLVESFAVAEGAAVLVKTGRLLRDTRPRIYETASLVRDVLLPGSERPGARAHEAMLRVRLLHAWVRRFAGQGGWDRARLGVPVNQADMLHTLLMFSTVVRRGVEALGGRATDRERRGFSALWRVFGALAGVDDAALFRGADEEDALYEEVRARYNPDDGSRALAWAVLGGLASEPPFFLPLSGMAALSRRLLGDELADAFALPRAGPWRRPLAGAARLWRGANGVLSSLPLSRALGEAGGRAFVEANRARILSTMREADYSFRVA
jgi:hypothetical protein